MLGVQLDQPRRILGVDLRNHGDSQHNEHMSYQAMAQDVIQFLDSQQLEKVILVGHSMGGKVAQALALLYPDRVEGLVVLDIAPVKYRRDQDPHWKAVEDILHAIYEVVESPPVIPNTLTEIDQALCQSIPDPALRAFVLTNYDHRQQQWKIPIATLVNQLEHIAGFDLPIPTTSTFDGDVFIIHGGQSRFVRHAYMDTISSYFPNHMLTTIRGAGHWVHAEAPDDVTALLKRYLDR
jgi:esterase